MPARQLAQIPQRAQPKGNHRLGRLRQERQQRSPHPRRRHKNPFAHQVTHSLFAQKKGGPPKRGFLFLFRLRISARSPTARDVTFLKEKSRHPEPTSAGEGPLLLLLVPRRLFHPTPNFQGYRLSACQHRPLRAVCLLNSPPPHRLYIFVERSFEWALTYCLCASDFPHSLITVCRSASPPSPRHNPVTFPR